jgi:hypothetical protein
MSRIGIVGGSYQSESVNADAQATVNLYVEHDESGAGKSEFQLYPRPGLTVFSVCGNGPQRASINANKRFFEVSGDTLYEVFTDGTNAIIGVVGNDGQPASMCNSSTQLAVVSNGTLYVYTFATAAFAAAFTGLGPVKMVGYSDGFFICLISNSQKFQISSPLDATAWDPTDVTQVSVFPDEILSMIVDHREIILHGVTKSVVYGNTGAADFPFSPIPSSYIEQGIAAAWCRDRLDNSEFWLGADDRGRLIANRLQGYSPIRVSNHAIENEWQSYATVEDAISYSFQMNGHTFWHITFPTANKSWVYDVAVGMWHQWSFLNNGINEADLSITHTFVFGLHLVGDRRNGNVYVMAIAIPDDNGAPIQRTRRAPHISIEQEWIFHNQFQLDMETGLSPIPDLLNDGTTVVQITGGTPPGSTFDGPTPQVYVVIIAYFRNGLRRISQLFGPLDSFLSHSGGLSWPFAYARVTFANDPDVVAWQVFFATDQNGATSVLSYSNAQVIAAGYIANLGIVSGPA